MIFFCQPEVPVRADYHPRFTARLAEGLAIDDAGRTRCHILLDAYRIKWVCILLNDFLPLGAARRSFANADAWASRCETQLAKARTAIDIIAR